MRDRLEQVLSVLLTAAALVFAGTFVHREFLSRPEALPNTKPSFVKGWQDVAKKGISIGNASAPIKIVEFSDLECPYCKKVSGILNELLQERPRDLEVVFVHYPLPQHRFALAAARVAECADRFGRFHEMTDNIYLHQDSLGILSWESLAARAGLPDTTAIGRCARDGKPVTRIQDGIAAGDRIAITATPTILVNGWRLPGAPGKDELLRVIDSLVQGKRPFADVKGGN